MATSDQWRLTWSGFGVELNPTLSLCFENLVARYSAPQRRYHTCRHLDECFEKLVEIRADTDHPHEVELALWFHDAVYEPGSSRNEARSAELATAALQEAKVGSETVERVRNLILATRHTAVPVGPDATAVVDVDLAILGSPPARFDEYECQIREEYSWVPTFIFKRNRKKLIKEFLARASIFTSARFRDRYEAPARQNLERSIRRLG